MSDFTLDQIQQMIWDGLLEIYEEEVKTNPRAVFHAGKASIYYPCWGSCDSELQHAFGMPNGEQWVAVRNNYYQTTNADRVKCFNLSDPDLFQKINEFLNGS